MLVKEYRHVYVNGALQAVYDTLPLANQAIASMAQTSQIVVVKVTESREIETVYGLPDSPPFPPVPTTPIPTVASTINHQKISVV